MVELKKLLFLDDVRNPFENPEWLVFSPIESPFEIFWVKTYIEFKSHIEKYGLPDGICFDHDLGDFDKNGKEFTGYDCAKWLIEYCINNNKQIPKYNIQSANLIGKTNIDAHLKNAIKFIKK